MRTIRFKLAFYTLTPLGVISILVMLPDVAGDRCHAEFGLL
jgi:hypothetical protein